MRLNTAFVAGTALGLLGMTLYTFGTEALGIWMMLIGALIIGKSE